MGGRKGEVRSGADGSDALRKANDFRSEMLLACSILSPFTREERYVSRCTSQHPSISYNALDQPDDADVRKVELAIPSFPSSSTSGLRLFAQNNRDAFSTSSLSQPPQASTSTPSTDPSSSSTLPPPSAQTKSKCPDLFDLPSPSSDKALPARNTLWISSWTFNVLSEFQSRLRCVVNERRKDCEGKRDEKKCKLTAASFFWCPTGRP